MDKYYTPKIEDIRIGYECEWVDSRTDWVPFKVVCTQDVIDAFDDELRTPYLTKEDIINEGWKHIDCKNETGVFYKNDFLLGFKEGLAIYSDTEQEWITTIVIYKPKKDSLDVDVSYKGNCPSINEFRFITNLLKIK